MNSRLIALVFIFVSLVCAPVLAQTNTPNAVTPRGPKGDVGCSMLATSGAPASAVGKNCDFAFDAAVGKVYGPKSNGVWGPPITMSPVVAAQSYADRARVDKDGAAAARTAAEAARDQSQSSASAAAMSQTAAAASASSAASAAAERLSVSHFASPQAAIDAASASGSRLFWPCGTYTASAALTIVASIEIDGENPGCVVVQTSSPTDDVIRVGNGVDHLRFVSIKNLTLWSTVAKTAGAAINARRTTDITLDHVNVGTQDLFASQGARLFDGLVANQFAMWNVTNSRFVGASNDCLRIYGSADQLFGAQFALGESNLVTNCGHDGVVVGGGAGGVYLDAPVQFSGRYGVYSTAALGGALNREIFLGDKFSSDNNVGDGIHVDANSVYLFSCDQCWSQGSSAGSGLVVAGQQAVGALFRLTAPHLKSNYGHGAYFQSGFNGHINLTGGFVSNNGSSAPAHGVWIESANGSASVEIVGATIQNNGTSGVGAGIEISGPGTLSRMAIIGNNVTFNAGAAIDNQVGCGPDHVVWGNVGHDANCIGSGAISGVMTAPTAAPNDNSTKIATTAYADRYTASPYTPTVSCATGTFGDASATGSYHLRGTKLVVNISVSVVANGSCATAVNVTLPPNMLAAAKTPVYGRDDATGVGLNGRVVAGSGEIQLQRSDGAFPGHDGASLLISGEVGLQ